MGSLTVGYVVRRVGMFFIAVWLGTTLIFFIPAWLGVTRSRPWSAVLRPSQNVAEQRRDDRVLAPALWA